MGMLLPEIVDVIMSAVLIALLIYYVIFVVVLIRDRKKISKESIVNNNSSIVSLYDRLLTQYSIDIESVSMSPYKSTIQQLKFTIDPRNASKLMAYFASLVNTNTLIVELPFAEKILPELDKLSRETIQGLKLANEINGRRLRNRSIFNLWSKFSVSIVSVLGFLTAVEKLNPGFYSSIYLWIPNLLIEGWPAARIASILGALGNAMLYTHRIKLVEAFSDILEMSLAARNGD
jgi:hypothetical protein